VRDIERWIRAHLAQPFTVAGMARELGMSPRTLDRRVRAATGKGPGDLVQRIRLERATHLLETSDSALDDVATAVGYGDATTLRRLLRRHLHTNPSELRRRSA
jgi:transcriptional regulator GlxA family with amidase domain